jgi:6-phospho-beta-glucosidase
MRALSGNDLSGNGLSGNGLSGGDSSGGGSVQLILNTPNAGAIPGLPADAVVEVPCVVTPDGAVPLPQDRPGDAQLGLMQRVKEVERLTVSAVMEGNRDHALGAFARHPLIGSDRLATELLAGYEAAFPALRQLWRGGR